MNKITEDYLKEKGFDTNHPDYVLKKFHKSSPKGEPEWHITVEAEYIPSTNKLGYSVSAWNCNKDNVITKRVQASVITTIEEFEKILDICEIKL